MKMYKIIIPKGIQYDYPKYKPMVLKLFKYDNNTHWWNLPNELDYLGANNVKIKDMDNLINHENCEYMLNFFETLESIGIKFEPNQRKLLMAGENTLTLGWSGTGKTTLSTFKILSL